MLQASTEPTHPSAGVICMGIRDSLIAFNVNLDAPLAEAEAIARAIRSPQIRALGLDLPSRGIVQVSMNLVDPLRLGPKAAFEAVAARSGRVVEAEVVGLVPDEVLDECSSIPLRRPARGVAAAFAQIGGG
jgi:glutamate formiminotransferase